jgi:hypothetical protein
MSRKRTARRVWVPLPPRGLRPKLDKDQVTDLALAHLTNLDLISHGQADADVLWQMVGGVFTWARVADLLQMGQDEMRAQLELATRLVERFGRTGRIGFSGVEYQAAKRGVEVMDELASLVDKPTAVAAAEWSEAKLNGLAEACAQRAAA